MTIRNPSAAYTQYGYRNLIYDIDNQILYRQSIIYLPTQSFNLSDTGILGSSVNGAEPTTGSFITSNIYAESVYITIGGRGDTNSFVWMPYVNDNHIGIKLYVLCTGGGSFTTFARVRSGWTIRTREILGAKTDGGMMVCTYTGGNVWYVN